MGFNSGFKGLSSVLRKLVCALTINFGRCKYEQLHIGYISVHGRITLSVAVLLHIRIRKFCLSTQITAYICYVGIMLTQNKEIILYWPFVLEIGCVFYEIGTDFFQITEISICLYRRLVTDLSSRRLAFDPRPFHLVFSG